MPSSSLLLRNKEIIEQAEQVLQESREFFQKHGIDPDKAAAYFESITTPEMRAEAKAAFEADMQAIEQEVREQMVSRASQPSAKPSARTTPRPPRQMI
ncbi:MAG: hypothetical protein WBC18_06170 [Ottowia sp.]